MFKKVEESISKTRRDVEDKKDITFRDENYNFLDKNILNRINIRLAMLGEMISKLKDIAIGTIQNETEEKD